MKYILFVDDEPLILEAMQRMLYPMRRDWHMRFADGGETALRMLAEQPADVVISDMRMPMMNGAELLNQVMRLYPKTVRLILSGYADLEMIMQCITGTHQFLAKPCNTETLKNVVERTLEMNAWVHNENLKAVVSRLATLPSMPALYFQILRELESAETKVNEIGETIAKDPGMTAKMLQLVNSAFFGLRRQLTDPTEAIQQLGLETVKSLVLGLHVFSELKTDGDSEISAQSLWQHSITTAARARYIARSEQLEKKIIEETFTAGLLHDVGRLVLIANLPQEYAQALAHAKLEQIPLIEAEKAVFGTTHAEVGGYLLGLWGLPISLVETAVYHHTPSECHIRALGPLAIVHVANALTQRPLPGQDVSQLPQMDQAFLEEIGVWERAQGWQRNRAQVAAETQ